MTGRPARCAGASGSGRRPPFCSCCGCLNNILLPFVVGMAVATSSIRRSPACSASAFHARWATSAVTILAMLLAVGLAMAILPPLFGQAQSLIINTPEYVVQAAARCSPSSSRCAKARPAGAQSPGLAVRCHSTGRPGARRRRQLRRRGGPRAGRPLQPAGAGLPDAGGDVLSAARLGKLVGASRRAAARSCRHHPRTRATIERAIAGYVRGQALSASRWAPSTPSA